MHQLAVVCEPVDHVQLVVDHPDVFVRIVRAHLDGVRPSPARLLAEQLVVLRPLVNEPAVAIDNEDDVLEPALPSMGYPPHPDPSGSGPTLDPRAPVLKLPRGGNFPHNHTSCCSRLPGFDQTGAS